MTRAGSRCTWTSTSTRPSPCRWPAEIEGAGGSPRFGLSGALSAGPLLPGSQLRFDPLEVGAPAFEVALSQRQKAAAYAVQAPSLVVPAGAFVDLSGNRIEPSSAPLEIVPDATGPAPADGGNHELDLGAGTLTVWLDEYSRAASTDAEHLKLAELGAAGNVRLAGRDGVGGPPGPRGL